MPAKGQIPLCRLSMEKITDTNHLDTSNACNKVLDWSTANPFVSLEYNLVRYKTREKSAKKSRHKSRKSAQSWHDGVWVLKTCSVHKNCI